MKFLVLEKTAYEGAEFSIYDTARDAVRALDSPGIYAPSPDAIFVVHDEISLDRLRDLAAAEGEPLPLVELEKRQESPYGNVAPKTAAYAMRMLLDRAGSRFVTDRHVEGAGNDRIVFGGRIKTEEK